MAGTRFSLSAVNAPPFIPGHHRVVHDPHVLACEKTFSSQITKAAMVEEVLASRQGAVHLLVPERFARLGNQLPSFVREGPHRCDCSKIGVPSPSKLRCGPICTGRSIVVPFSLRFTTNVAITGLLVSMMVALTRSSNENRLLPSG